MANKRTDFDAGYRFLFEQIGVRGQLVRLDTAWREVLRRVEYPAGVRVVLGEAFAASALLAATLKFDGRLSLQLNATGPVHLLLAQATSSHGLRALARWQAEPPTEASIAELFPDGSLTLSIDTGNGVPYSGVVPLAGSRMQDALATYFRDSEQLPTRLWLHATEEVAAGLLLQRLPGTASDPDDWERLCLQAGTVRPDELTTLAAEDLLGRLFPEDDIRLFQPSALRFECSCSVERSAEIMRHLGEAELRDIVGRGERITVTCEFCGAPYHFDAVDCAQLLDGMPFAAVSPTRH